MKVLGIYTGRPKSTTEWMIKTALKGAQEEGAEVTLINIRDWDLKPCTGCNACLMHLMSGKGPFCMHKDDGAKIGDMIIEADGLIVAAPLYEKLPPSEYKVLNDRMGPGCDVAVLGMSNKKAIEAGHPENIADLRGYVAYLHWMGEPFAQLQHRP